MQDVDIYKARAGKRSSHYANDVAAHLPGVRVHLAATATAIGLTAAAMLESHISHSSWRGENLPPPRITVTEGSKLDWFVALEAEADSEEEAIARAMAIEFGRGPVTIHRRGQNQYEHFGSAAGLNVLRRAIDAVEFMGGG